MRAIDLLLRATFHLIVGAMLAVVLWGFWIVSLTGSSGAADAPVVQILRPCPCMATARPANPAART
ncbi:hypothetical protein B0G69_8214 [Paraburkholderia sp. RAU2J]|nr:hypothetical protein B0G69_8214 [Paraburkholderia sp. RAU2J]